MVLWKNPEGVPAAKSLEVSLEERNPSVRDMIPTSGLYDSFQGA